MVNILRVCCQVCLKQTNKQALKLIIIVSSPSLSESPIWHCWQWSADAAIPTVPTLPPWQKAPELSSHLRQDTAVADTQPLKVSWQCDQTQDIFPHQAPALTWHLPSHGHITLPPQEEMHRCCPNAGTVFPANQPLSGRCPCLGPACHSGTEGTVGAALGAHSQKHGGGNQYQVDKQSQGSTMCWIGLWTVHACV